LAEGQVASTEQLQKASVHAPACGKVEAEMLFLRQIADERVRELGRLMGSDQFGKEGKKSRKVKEELTEPNTEQDKGKALKGDTQKLGTA
jgi:hypothetical protein